MTPQWWGSSLEGMNPPAAKLNPARMPAAGIVRAVACIQSNNSLRTGNHHKCISMDFMVLFTNGIIAIFLRGSNLLALKVAILKGPRYYVEFLKAPFLIHCSF
ncbi:hypothetical protein GOODEAATRI_031318 [Goodea atripinnis]|uniref:Uncharacterized protein n=1 Tax=Goodea atripinnis TaxID=208336 RepID=A0ABV0NG48_9TELE